MLSDKSMILSSPKAVESNKTKETEAPKSIKHNDAVGHPDQRQNDTEINDLVTGGEYIFVRFIDPHVQVLDLLTSEGDGHIPQTQ